jgi:hypothetical protein
VESQQAGRVKGLASIALELTSLKLSDGQHVEISTDSFTKRGPESHGSDAEKIGGGAALGAIIGAIAGGGKGAAIGAGVGGAAGTGAVVGTRGKPAVLPSETRISFRINNTVTITERRGRSWPVPLDMSLTYVDVANIADYVKSTLARYTASAEHPFRFDTGYNRRQATALQEVKCRVCIVAEDLAPSNIHEDSIQMQQCVVGWNEKVGIKCNCTGRVKRISGANSTRL